jgi:hypothetical protein
MLCRVENKRNMLSKATISKTLPVKLKLTMKPDATAVVYYRQGAGSGRRCQQPNRYRHNFYPNGTGARGRGCTLKAGHLSRRNFRSSHLKAINTCNANLQFIPGYFAHQRCTPWPEPCAWFNFALK